MSDHLTDKGSLITSDLLSDNEHMNKKRIEGHDDPTFFQMPGRRKMVGAKETISMYDSRNNIGYDKIDVTGLTPYDYRKCLEKGLGI